MASVDEALRETFCHPFDVISQSFTIRGQKTPFVNQVGKRGLHWLPFSLLICKYDEYIFDDAIQYNEEKGIAETDIEKCYALHALHVGARSVRHGLQGDSRGDSRFREQIGRD